MASPYANAWTTSPAGGSPVAPAPIVPAANPVAAGRGSSYANAWAAPAATVAPVAAAAVAPAHHGGGFLSDIGNAVGDVAHEGAAIGTGIYDLGKSAIAPGTHPSWGALGSEWEHALTTDPFAPTGVLGSKSIAADPLARNVVAMGKQTGESIIHPLRDPVQTGLSVLALASLGAGSFARAGYAAKAISAANDAAKAGDLEGAAALRVNAIKAIASPLHKVPTEARILAVPKLVRAEGPVTEAGQAPLAEGSANVYLHASGSHLTRAGQTVVDKALQHGIDNGGGLLGRYAAHRAGTALTEDQVMTRNLRSLTEKNVVASQARGPIKAALRKSAFDAGVTQKEGNLAVFLRSANVTPAEAATYWETHAAQGENTGKLAALARSLDEKGVLQVGDHGHMEVNGDLFPKLRQADEATRLAQVMREKIIAKNGLLDPETMTNRKALVAETMGSEAARNPITGVREGDAYTSLKTARKVGPQGLIARSVGDVTGKARSFITGHEATGTGIEKGLIPDNTILGAARDLHDALRYQNTADARANVVRFGSDVKRTPLDVMVRDPNSPAGKISAATDLVLGRTRSTLDTLPDDDLTLAQGIRDKLKDAIPGIEDNFAADKRAGIGAPATPGYKWVPKGLLGDLTHATEARSTVGRFGDAINTAVTDATVYLRPGHLATRGLTNAVTNIVHGSGSIRQVIKSSTLAHDLTDAEKHELYQKAAAVTGTHGTMALPHEGQGAIARSAAKGAGWWAKHVDAPFRINNMLYEFRQIGLDTPEQVRGALAELENPGSTGITEDERAQLQQAVRAANRASIKYDGLSAIEKRYLTRYFWFYPWVKGATRYAFHVASEHPLKAVAVGQTGAYGARQDAAQLGPTPSYEDTLTALTGGANPLTSNFSSFTPFSTVGSDAQMLQHPLREDTGVFGSLNPVYSAIAAAVRGQGPANIAGQALQPTPEYQIASSFFKPASKLFGPTVPVGSPHENTALTALLRALGGAGVPRPTSIAQLAKDAAYEKARHITIAVK